MPKISRIRLHSIGHPNARFEEVILDLRGASGRADHGSIWLENGGGKTSLLNLFFSHLRPGRREFIGKEKGKTLEDYLLPGDTGFLAVEWELDGGGAADLFGEVPRLITVSYYEMRRSTDAEGSHLEKVHLLFRNIPDVPELSLEGIPVVVERSGGGLRKRTVRGLVAAMEELRHDHPHAEIDWTDQVGKWAALLERYGIDNEVFALMVLMNQSEGGASEAFKFPDENAFVDFVLELVTRDGFGAKVAEALATYKGEVIERLDDLRLEREMVGGLRDALVPLAEVAGERRLVTDSALATAGLADGLLRLALVRAERCESDAAAEHGRAARERETAEHLVRQARLEEVHMAAIDLATAVARVEAAGTTQREAEEHHAAAQREVALWSAAGYVRDIIRQEAIAEAAMADLRRTQDENAPLLEDLTAAARAYAGTLCAALDRARSARDTLADRERAARDRRREHERLAVEAEKRATESESAAGEMRRAGERARAERENLVMREILRAGEAVEDAAARLAEERDTANRRAAAERRRVADFEATRPGLIAERERAEAAVGEARRELDKAEHALAEAERARDTFLSDPWLARCLEQEEVDPAQIAHGTLRVLDIVRRRMQGGLFAAWRDRGEDAAVVEALREAGLLPASEDARAVISALRTAGVNAWSGWEYISQTVQPGAAARDFIRRLPHLVTGVVIRTEDWDRAVAVLELGGIELGGPVAVAAQDALDGTVDAAVVGPSHDAHYDRNAAASELRRRVTRLETAEDRISGIERDLNELNGVAGRLDAFLHQYPDGWLSDQRTLVDELAIEAAQAEARLAAAMERVAELMERILATAEAANTAEREASLAANSLDHVDSYRRRHGDDLDRFDRGAADHDARASEARRKARTHAEAGEAAESEAEEARTVKEGRGIEISRHEERLGEIRYLGTEPVVATIGEIEVLRRRYDDLRAQYEGAVNENALAAKYETAKEVAEQARRDLDGELGHWRNKGVAVDEAAVRAAVESLGDDQSLVGARKIEATEALKVRFALLGNAGRQAKEAQNRLTAAEEFVRSLGSVRPAILGENDVPVAVDDAEALADNLRRSVQESREAAEAAAHASEDAVRLAGVLLARAKALRREIAGIEATRARIAQLLGEAEPDAVEVPEPEDDDEVVSRVQELEAEASRLHGAATELDRRSGLHARSMQAVLTNDRYVGVRNQITRDLPMHSPREVEDAASVLISRLDQRTEVLRHIIDEHERKRGILVLGALREAEEGLAALASVNSAARLPTSAGQFAGVEFLRINDRQPKDETERRSRIAAEIDALLRESVLPSGLAIAQRLVRALAGRFSVRVKVPNPIKGPEDLTIVDLSKKSGGEHLTCAVMMHCILTRIRARQRRSSGWGTNTLVLDNPFGISSRVAFLDIQREVAEANGTQLIYTTGIKDYDAVASLPNVNRVRPAGITADQKRIVLERAQVDEGLAVARLVRSEVPVPVSAGGGQA